MKIKTLTSVRHKLDRARNPSESDPGSDSEAGGVPQSETALKPDAGNLPKARRILLVDDNPDVADSFKILLEAIGHRVLALNTGGEVIPAIRRFRPQVVFLDIGMPDMDGYQVAAAIRAAGLDLDIHLVAITGCARNSDQEAGLDTGFDRHLLKPPSLVQIEALLAELD